MTRQWSGCALLDERRNAIEIDLKIVTKKKQEIMFHHLELLKMEEKKISVLTCCSLSLRRVGSISDQQRTPSQKKYNVRKFKR